MQKPSIHIKIYIGLILTLALLAAVSVFLPQGSVLQNAPESQMPASKPLMALVSAAAMIFIYGGLGFIGYRLSQKLEYADIWDERVSNKQRLLTPLFTGAAIGVLFIAMDVILSQFHQYGQLPHPPFPTSLVASAVAGIGEEIIFRLCFISFWVWLVSYFLLKKRWQQLIFWIVAVFSAIAFGFAHIPSVMILFGFDSFGEIPTVLLSEIIILNGVLSLFTAYYFRKYGILAAIGIHFWADVVWHVVWGSITGN